MLRCVELWTCFSLIVSKSCTFETASISVYSFLECPSYEPFLHPYALLFVDKSSSPVSRPIPIVGRAYGGYFCYHALYLRDLTETSAVTDRTTRVCQPPFHRSATAPPTDFSDSFASLLPSFCSAFNYLLFKCSSYVLWNVFLPHLWYFCPIYFLLLLISLFIAFFQLHISSRFVSIKKFLHCKWISRLFFLSRNYKATINSASLQFSIYLPFAFVFLRLRTIITRNTLSESPATV